MVSFVRRDDRSKGGEREVDTGEAKRQLAQVNIMASRCDTTYGTKFVWNSFKSTFSEPSKRREAVIEETT